MVFMEKIVLRYSCWGEFLKSKRRMRFRSARDFCAQKQIGISYPQYSRYEAGHQLPPLLQAMEMFRHLDITPAEGMLEWCRAQLNGIPEQKLLDQQITSMIADMKPEAVTPGLKLTRPEISPALAANA